MSGAEPADKIPPSPSVSLISLGCPRTLVDSEHHLGKLAQSGFTVRRDPENADVVIINTCAFVQDAIKESIDTVLQTVELKKRGKIKTVIVAGCLVQRFKDELIKELPEVDGFVGADGFGEIQTVVEQALAGKQVKSLRVRPRTMQWEEGSFRAPLSPLHYAYLKISEGCLKGCSFCIIPKIKGPLVSRSIESLVSEARQLVEERGVKELIVVGQDTSDYGTDLYGRARTAELLQALAKINGLKWIRLLYCHPHGLTDEIINVIRDEPAMCKYLDIAIEHADDHVLKRMNRLVTQSELREKIARLRARVPDIVLRTSVVVGFPGETEATFERMLDFLREIRFERLGAFTYSRERGSASYNYPNQVPAPVAQQRLARLMELQQHIAQELNEALVGQILDVVIDEPDASEPDQYLGRTRADCPEVDGSVFVKSRRALSPGTWLPVRITDSYEYDLVGISAADATA